MIDFEFVSPTKLYFGKDKELLIGKILKELNVKRVLLVLGSSSSFKNGLYDRVVSKLDEENIKHYTLKGIRANPSLDSVIEGLKIAKENDVDFILSIGGGSVIDASKSIAVNFYYDGDPYDFSLYLATPKKALPIGVILTIAASGSELSSSCVISNDKKHLKQGFNSDLIRPLFAIYNPELTFSVSKYQTGCGIVDIISHSLERYFAKSNTLEFADEFALTVIKETIRVGERCINEPNNYDARGILMLLSSYSHNGLTGLGKKYALTIHALEHALSAYKVDIAHGAGLSVLIPAWMEYVYNYDLDKFAHFGEVVFNLSYLDKKESARIGIQSLKEYFKKIGMPTSLTELGLTAKDLPLISGKLTNNGTRLIGPLSIKPLNEEDIINIFRYAL